jgi:hypothetical protein
MKMPTSVAEIVAVLRMPPANVASVKDPLVWARASMAMPVPEFATISPLLVMPPEKFDMTTTAALGAASAGCVSGGDGCALGAC